MKIVVDAVSRLVRHGLSGVGAILVAGGLATPDEIAPIVDSGVAVATGIAGIASSLLLSYLSDKFKSKLF